MGGANYCCIPGCRTRNGHNSKFPEKSHITLFSQPKNEEELNKWSKAVQRTDKEMKIGDKVCELHFAEDSIIRYFETLLPDGTVWRIERKNCALKPGSIPTIFPNSKNISKKGRPENNIKVSPEKRKIPANTYSCLKKKKILNKNVECQQNTVNKDHEHSITIVNNKSSENAETVENSEHSINNVPENAQLVKNENSDHTIMALNFDCHENVKIGENENSILARIILNESPEAFAYSTLVNTLQLISRPDWSWGISVHDEFIMCAKWNKGAVLMKRVIVDCNLNIQVFLKNRAIDFDNIKISSIKDLSSILNEVDRYRMCAHVDNKEKTGCDGYILPKMQSILCEYCRLIGDNKVNKKRNMYWLSKGRNFAKHQILYEKIDALNKQNALLKEQLSKIIKIKAVWKLSNQTNLNQTED